MAEPWLRLGQPLLVSLPLLGLLRRLGMAVLGLRQLGLELVLPPMRLGLEPVLRVFVLAELGLVRSGTALGQLRLERLWLQRWSRSRVHKRECRRRWDVCRRRFG